MRAGSNQRLLREAVHADGGPLIHNGSEEEQHSFDATCRKLHRFWCFNDVRSSGDRLKVSSDHNAFVSLF